MTTLSSIIKRLLKSGFSGILVFFILICVVTGIFSFQYYRQLQDTLQDESRGYLLEVATRTGANINRIVDNNFGALYTTASVFETTKAASFAEIAPIIESQRAYCGYQNIFFIDQAGHSYDANGKSTLLDMDASLRADLLNQQTSLTTSQLVDGQECILFAIPLNNVTIGDRQMLALAATYSPTTFNEVLSMNSFDGQGYSQIINKNGTLVVRPNSQAAFKTGYNLFNSIADASFETSITLEHIKKDIDNNASNLVCFTQGELHTYMVYTPLAFDNWYLATFVPVEAVNARSTSLLKITFLLCGLITLAFAGLVSFLFYSFRTHQRKLEQIAFVDETTGGNTIQRFYFLAQETLMVPNRPPYALIYSNFSKFKVLNEQFGRDICDTLLRAFNDIVTDTLQPTECIGRLTADNFCLLLKYDSEEELLRRFRAWYGTAEKFLQEHYLVVPLPTVEFGIFIVTDTSLPFPQMIDRAKLAMRESPRLLTNKIRYAIYDDHVRRQLFREKHLEDIMEEALKQRELQVYLQPKYRISDEKIGGAEALLRWASASDGMIFPDEFIPLFEKNGFIIQLDLWVFEEVCRTLRFWIDNGREPVKISVNCSRAHLKDPHFLNPYRQIAEQYRIPEKLLEIELTESIVLENVSQLSQVINDIHAAGFECSIDDFGSGYSSLNLLHTLTVDTLKLDKIFFRTTDSSDPKRTESVIRSIITMAQSLSMETVAEGIEQRAQVEMLRQAGCDYIQGYVFAKPMPIPAFEDLLFNQDETH